MTGGQCLSHLLIRPLSNLRLACLNVSRLSEVFCFEINVCSLFAPKSSSFPKSQVSRHCSSGTVTLFVRAIANSAEHLEFVARGPVSCLRVLAVDATTVCHTDCPLD